MPPKSKWRQPDAVHFQVVHRSMRDADPEAGPHVLKPYQPANQQKGKSRADLVREDPSLEGKAGPTRSNVGEAALYGVYYDDTEYDYMQHLRPMNDGENSRRGGAEEEDDTDAIWVPSAVQPKDRAKSFALKEDDEKTEAGPSLMLPASAFASKELPLEYNGENVDPALQGLQPDMDPHLRQTLEALDDEEFVDDALEDDFFDGLIQGGQWDGNRTEQDAWRDEAPEGDTIWLDPVQRALQEQREAAEEGKELSLEARVALFKHQQKQKQAGAASDDSDSGTETAEARDAVGQLPTRAAMPRTVRAPGSVSSTGSALGKSGRPGALARRAASTRAESVGGGSTVWSMSSSSMFRNTGLTDLDDRFDRVLRKYGVETGDEALDQLGEEEEEEEEVDYDNVEQLTREDFDNIMDEFLDKHEVVAGKMRPTLGTRDTTANEKLEMIRKGLGEVRLTENDEEVGTPASENPFLNPDIIGADREKWDVETIQTTKTNLENHPRTITAAESVAPSGTHAPSTIAGGGARTLGAGDVRIPKIRIHPRTGVPQVVGYTVTQKDRNVRKEVAAAEERQPTTAKGPASDEASDDEAATESLASEGVPAPPHKRDRNESKEERRARKAAVKLEKQSRRADKGATKQAFADERKRQLRAAQRQHEATGGQAAAHLT